MRRVSVVSGVVMTLVNRTKALAERLGRSKSLTADVRTAPLQSVPVEVPAQTQAQTRAVIERAVPRRAVEPSIVTPVDEQATNNRRAKRKQTSLPAMIAFQNMRVTVPCTVADMSGTGAKLTFTKSAINQYGDLEHMPKTFTLILKADRMQVESELMWCHDGKIGVRFLGPPKPVDSRR